MPEALPSSSVLALGAWLKNTACLLDGGRVEMSPVHGDLSDPAACLALEASVRRLIAHARQPIAALAHDLHPDFFSTRLALALADELGVPAMGVQHHHAHIAAVMAEHGVNEPVVGLALDGVGLGNDGQAWGGELLWVSTAGWRRLGHLWPLALPGGDMAAREPWRMAASALHALGRGDEIEARFSPAVGPGIARGVQVLLSRGLNCPTTSSAGRWFDAAAGALGLSVRQADEAEAALALQHQAQQWVDQHGEPGVTTLLTVDGSGRLDLRPLLARLLEIGASPQAAACSAEAAASFHASLADSLAAWAAVAARRRAARTVCLGGGCFFNPLLTARVTRRLQALGLQVLRPSAHACGDAGLALGQAWAAARQLASPSCSAPANESLSCA